MLAHKYMYNMQNSSVIGSRVEQSFYFNTYGSHIALASCALFRVLCILLVYCQYAVGDCTGRREGCGPGGCSRCRSPGCRHRHHRLPQWDGSGCPLVASAGQCGPGTTSSPPLAQSPPLQCSPPLVDAGPGQVRGSCYDHYGNNYWRDQRNGLWIA